MKKLGAEFFGTFWLVLGGCGSAVLAAAFPELGIGFVGVSLAFGLTVLTMAFAIGHISGCHLNPAVSIGLWAGGRFPAKDLLPYIIAQVLGGIAAGGVLYLIASGKADFSTRRRLRLERLTANIRRAAIRCRRRVITEVVMTAFFLIVILGATDKRAPAGFAPIAIGLCLTLIHLISIPVTNTSVNPARSTGVALFVGDWATCSSSGCSGSLRSSVHCSAQPSTSSSARKSKPSSLPGKGASAPFFLPAAGNRHTVKCNATLPLRP